jgi:hypothetical protein
MSQQEDIADKTYSSIVQEAKEREERAGVLQSFSRACPQWPRNLPKSSTSL